MTTTNHTLTQTLTADSILAMSGVNRPSEIRSIPHVIVVCGFPRSGTSLTMQMLHAAGVRCSGEWPAFESDECNVSHKMVPRDFVLSMDGGAIKVLDPQHIALPAGIRYTFIFMRRNRDQQAVSFIKFLKSAGWPVRDSKCDRAKLAESIAEDEKKAERILRSHEGHDWFTLRFEDLIDRTEETLGNLAAKLRLDPLAMRGCVVPRGSKCLPQMLEIAQLETISPSRRTGK